MYFFQQPYRDDVAQLLNDKEHVTDTVGIDVFLHSILLLSISFLVISTCMIIYMLCRRKMKISLERKEKILVQKFEDFLSSFLVLPVNDAFSGIQKNNEMDVRLNQMDITNPYRRKILADTIYGFKLNLKGMQEQQLTNYFFGLGMQEDAIKDLKSNKWTTVTRALKMINAFNIMDAKETVISLIDNANREISIHAIETIIRMEKNLDVLDLVDFELNDWEKHKIYHLIQTHSFNTDLLIKIRPEATLIS